jgi:uncharacterized protein (TIGR03546 family)
VLALKILASFFKALNEKASPRAIAGGLALGAVIGLTPKGSFHNAVVVMLIFLLPVNKSASLVSAGLFTLCSYLGDPLFNALGEALLTAPALSPLWTSLYNTPVVPWTRFNNTLVLGSLLFSLLIFYPLFLVTARFVVAYREKVVATASKWKIVQLLRVSKIYALYENLS